MRPQATADQLGERIELVQGDLRDPGERRRVWTEAADWRGSVDVLVNNAGAWLASEMNDAEAWQQGWQANQTGGKTDLSAEAVTDGVAGKLEGVIAAPLRHYRAGQGLSAAELAKNGQGSLTVRTGTQHGHEYRVLGSLKGRTDALEPTLVTLTDASDVFPLFQHPGTEFIYMLSGKMIYGHGSYEYTMQAGDSLLLDGEGPHGPLELLDLPIRFLAIAAK